MDLSGKVCLITGAATGIGFQYCKELLRNGCQRVCIADMNQSNGEKAMKHLNTEFGSDRCMFIKTDVTKKTDLEAAFQACMTTWKRLDIVINNAGIMNDLQWELQIAVNLNAVVTGCHLATKYMGKNNNGHGGTLVNIASILGLQSMASIPVYVATKHAVLGLSRSLGMEYNLNKTGIRVLTMCPGVTITELITGAHVLTPKEDAKEVRRELDTLPDQKTEDVAKGMIQMLKHGRSGSVWVAEGGEPIYEVEIPDRLKLRKH